MIKRPEWHIDKSSNPAKVILELSSDDEGHVNHFLDALLLMTDTPEGQKLMSKLKSREKLASDTGQIETWMKESDLPKFFDLLLSLMTIPDPFSQSDDNSDDNNNQNKKSQDNSSASSGIMGEILDSSGSNVDTVKKMGGLSQ